MCNYGRMMVLMKLSRQENIYRIYSALIEIVATAGFYNSYLVHI